MIHHRWTMKESNTESYTVCDSIYRKHLGQMKPQEDKEDRWMCGEVGKENGSDCSVGTGLPFGVMKICWNRKGLFHDTEFTKCHWTAHFQVVNFMLHEFYTNFFKVEKLIIVSQTHLSLQTILLLQTIQPSTWFEISLIRHLLAASCLSCFPTWCFPRISDCEEILLLL
jgi:hypothetical protein